MSAYSSAIMWYSLYTSTTASLQHHHKKQLIKQLRNWNNDLIWKIKAVSPINWVSMWNMCQRETSNSVNRISSIKSLTKCTFQNRLQVNKHQRQQPKFWKERNRHLHSISDSIISTRLANWIFLKRVPDQTSAMQHIKWQDSVRIQRHHMTKQLSKLLNT